MVFIENKQIVRNCNTVFDRSTDESAAMAGEAGP
jgi:hypothetical protein